MRKLKLPLFCERGRIPVTYAPVYIPLHIFDMILPQYLADDLINIFNDFFICHIQCKLISAPHRRSARYTDRPFRMGTVQFTVLRDHLRLHPDPELHAEIIDPLNQSAKTPLQLLLIDNPVPEP